jgi:hypothetical protein
VAVSFSTSNPKALLEAFKKHVNQEHSKDKITTWEENRQGNFTHKSPEVAGQAWMCPEISEGFLHFYIRAPKGAPINRYIYSYYHGHLSETFINHFPTLFTKASSTANAVKSDNIPGNYSS